MSQRRFFIEHVAQDAEHIIVAGQEARHAIAVLRLQPGETIELRDGHGGGWTGVITGIKGPALHVRLTGRQEVRTESPLDLTLAIAYSRSDRMELVFRQATELGVRRVAAFRAERSQYGLSEAKRSRREERWLKIAREALCQCGRAAIPEITFLADVTELLRKSREWQEGVETGGLNILALETEREQSLLSLWQKFPACRQVLIIVGPEGGWTLDEMERFRESGFHQVHLGPRILRLETAATAFLTAAQLLWGDFGTSLKEAKTP
jgi:16S rRNA (uracil1498-N3)-methyltransferase